MICSGTAQEAGGRETYSRRDNIAAPRGNPFRTPLGRLSQSVCLLSVYLYACLVCLPPKPVNSMRMEAMPGAGAHLQWPIVGAQMILDE